MVSGSDPRTGMSATVQYLPQAWGLALRVQVRGIAAGTRCELQVVGASGRDVPAGGWAVAAGHAWAWYPASSPFPLSGVHGFVLTTARGKVLVRVPATAVSASAPSAASPATVMPRAVRTGSSGGRSGATAAGRSSKLQEGESGGVKSSRGRPAAGVPGRVAL